MTMHRSSSARQAILGPGGEILGWKKIQLQPAKIRNVDFGIWNDMVQAWEYGPTTLSLVADALHRQVCEGAPMVYAGDFCPRPLNAAERKYIRVHLFAD